MKEKIRLTYCFKRKEMHRDVSRRYRDVTNLLRKLFNHHKSAYACDA
jgi:hypothetical protein